MFLRDVEKFFLEKLLDRKKVSPETLRQRERASHMQIKKTSSIAANRIKLVVYGAPGIGKTKLATGLPGEPFIISAERGLLSISDKDYDAVEIDKWSDTQDLIKLLGTDEAKKKYRWLFIDSITELAQKLVEYLQQKYPLEKDILRLWREYDQRFTAFLKYLRDFEPYNVVFTCLEAVNIDKMNQRYYSPDVPGRKMPRRIPALFDEIFWYTKQEVNGNMTRVLVTDAQQDAYAKDRSGQLQAIEIINRPEDFGPIISKMLRKGKGKDNG